MHPPDRSDANGITEFAGKDKVKASRLQRL
jgi:hypothetical protein